MVVFSLGALLLIISSHCFAKDQPAELILHNGKIVTVDNDFSIAQAIAIGGGKILHVGTNDHVLQSKGAKTKLVDLKGKTVLPGLIDSHVHPGGASMFEFDHPVPEMESVQDVLDYVSSRTKAVEEGSWIWVSQVFITRLREQRYPTRQELDQAAPKHPVVFRTGPDASLNSLALQLSGIDKDFKVVGAGKIERDPKTGEPTGILRACTRYIKGGNRVTRPTTDKDRIERLAALFADYNSVGLTCVADRSASSSSVQRYAKLYKDGRLSVRVAASWRIGTDGSIEKIQGNIRNVAKHPLHSGGDAMLRIVGIKTFLDGGMLTGSAYMRKPWGVSKIYSIDDPRYRGVRFIPKEKLVPMVSTAVESGLQFTAHSVGDGAVHALLDAYEQVNKQTPLQMTRPCITHSNFMSKEAVEKMKQLGVVADIQPAWLYLDARTLTAQFGYERLRYFQPLKTIFESGVIAGGGSDHMQKIGSLRSINPYNPFLGMWVTITRQARWYEGRLHPEEALSREQAIRFYTRNNAHIVFLDDKIGSLEKGKLADLIVLDRDILTCATDEIKDTKVLRTYLNGTLVYAANDIADRASALSTLAPNVLSEENRQAARAMVRDDLKTRLSDANEQSSKSWHAIKNRAEWEKFRKPRLDALRSSLGLPEPPNELEVVITKTIKGDGFAIDNLVFQSQPGLWVTANLYRPVAPRDSMPGMLICHSHHRPKEHGELQDMGMTWARAGCLVLVMDQIGHGERRQHPFRSSRDYKGEFRVSRQDYYFRYDTGMQLHLAGSSLVGWMANDLMRGVDLLLKQKGVDPNRIILLGAVAGGGDPVAVTAAIDQRIAAAVPFNFGGPQPETRFPLPDDAETSFNYAGGGSWESTRNLRRSAGDGFLPWVIVGGIAPRGLVFAHEFNWDQPRDPVWKRLEKLYGFYDASDRLAFAHGRGELRGRAPEATHCTHIGRAHRKMIHPTFQRWFDIRVAEEDEYSQRLPAEQLQWMSAELAKKLKLQRVHQILRARAKQPRKPTMSAADLRHSLRGVLGLVDPVATPKILSRNVIDSSLERIVLQPEPGISVPLLILKPKGTTTTDGKRKVVVAAAQGGKAAFLKHRSVELATLIDAGVAVCLPDVRGVGEVAGDQGRGQYSTATGRSSTELMLGGTTVGAQLRDLRTVVTYIRSRDDFDADRIAVWGDSFALTNGADTDFKVPRRIDGRPRQPEPLGGLLAMMCGLFDEKICAVYCGGGLSQFRSVLDHWSALIPHDVVVPGLLKAGDLPAIAAALAPRPLRIDRPVSGLNLPVTANEMNEIYKTAIEAYESADARRSIILADSPTPVADWLLNALKSTTKEN
jgi:hypothetical protein